MLDALEITLPTDVPLDPVSFFEPISAEASNLDGFGDFAPISDEAFDARHSPDSTLSALIRESPPPRPAPKEGVNWRVVGTYVIGIGTLGVLTAGSIYFGIRNLEQGGGIPPSI